MRRFERELKDKLIQRSNSKLSEEACLIKMFKFFDLKDTGYVDFGLFSRVAEKMGMYFPPEELQQLFFEYDSNQQGVLDYKELAKIIFGNQQQRA